MASKSGGKAILGKVGIRSAYTVRVKNFVVIDLSHTVLKINVILPFTRKFKIAAKNSGKVIFVKSLH